MWRAIEKWKHCLCVCVRGVVYKCQLMVKGISIGHTSAFLKVTFVIHISSFSLNS